ncbi:hypothetical protein ACXX82_04130 [Glaciimonas sp. GNP009]
MWQQTNEERLLAAARNRNMRRIDLLFRMGVNVLDAFGSIDNFHATCGAKELEILVCASPGIGVARLEYIEKKWSQAAHSVDGIGQKSSLTRLR